MSYGVPFQPSLLVSSSPSQSADIVYGLECKFIKYLVRILRKQIVFFLRFHILNAWKDLVVGPVQTIKWRIGLLENLPTNLEGCRYFL